LLYFKPVKALAIRANYPYNAAAMHDMDDTTRLEILGEAMMDELKAIREYLEFVAPRVGMIPEMKEGITALKSDMALMKSLYREHQHQLEDHDVRITRLEQQPPQKGNDASNHFRRQFFD
jgi:hypothetical protein